MTSTLALIRVGPAQRNTGQRQEIMDTLVDNGEDFHHLNRGLTIVAKAN